MECGHSIEELRKASVGDISNILHEISNRIGSAYYAFSRPQLRERIIFDCTASNFPEPWRKTYFEKRYFRSDPLIVEAVKSNLPVFWDDVGVRASNGVVSDAMAGRRGFGVRSGVAVPVRGRGGQFSIFSFWATDPLPAFRQRFEAQMCCVYGITIHLHDLAFRQVSGVPRHHLNARELECLRWTSLGKTAWEISILISIPERTVHYHLSEASKKLGAANKTAAVAIAIRNNLIDL